MKKQICLIYCNCGAGIISKEKQVSITRSFQNFKVDVFELHDICSFSVHEPEILNRIEEQYDKKVIVACYPRAIKNMFLQNNISLSNFEVLNFRELSVDKIAETIQKKDLDEYDSAKYEVVKSSLDVPAWYPVIDKSLCTLCGQCARFCVFGVYKFSKKNLEVINPLSCKNNCPACGRTCPASAIIFPRLHENSALSGAMPGQEQTGLKPVPKEGLFGMLNERNNTRRNIFRQGFMQQAEAEKLKAIEEFKRLKKRNND